MYKINPKILPRPSEYYDIYKNTEKKNNYNTIIDSHPPYSTSNYLVNEMENSSCRFLRFSLIKIPNNQKILNLSNLSFGIYFQPFSEIKEKENLIPIINYNKGILKCKKCNCYINNKFIISFSDNRDKIIICNICHYENILNNNIIGFKQEYIIGNPIENCFELKFPTIDYYISDNLHKELKYFIPHYLFCIDISDFSFQINFPFFILNYISSILNFFHNSHNSFIGFCTYYFKGVQFYLLGKNKELNVINMNDIKNPFCPINSNKIYYNVIKDEKDILILIERIINYLEEKIQKKENSNNNIPGTMIYSGIESLIERGGRIILFNCSSSNLGFGSSNIKKEKEYINKINEYKLYYSSHQNFNCLIDKCLKYNIAIDQFIFGDINYDLTTFSQLSNLTGGNIKFYDFNINIFNNKNMNNNYIIIKSYFEKLSNDIFRLISRPNFYDIKMKIIHSNGIEVNEVYGIKRKENNYYIISSFNPDSSCFFDLKISNNFNNKKAINFQLIIFYTDNYNKRYLRVFNYTCKTSNNISEIYSFCDIEVLTKLIIIKEINNIYNKSIKEIREDLLNKLINIFYYYKKETSQNNLGQLILPPQIKYLPSFINSFFKKGIFSLNRIKYSNLKINYLLNFFIQSPIYSFILYLYPKMYKINLDKLNSIYNKKRLSLEIIKLNRAYLITNGEFLDFYIFDCVKKEFYELLFGKEDYFSCLLDKVHLLNEEMLKNEKGEFLFNFIEKLKYQNLGNCSPLRLFFLNRNSCLKNEYLKNNLIEDSFDKEISYPDFLFSLYEKIESKFK